MDRRAALDAALKAARPVEEQVALYHQAADLMTLSQARRFHLTHAWVYALEAGDETTIEALERELRALGGL
ncbi:MAG: hypothetical protein AAGE38_19370 [Pseudomonadota bacterium]